MLYHVVPFLNKPVQTSNYKYHYHQHFIQVMSERKKTKTDVMADVICQLPWKKKRNNSIYLNKFHNK